MSRLAMLLAITAAASAQPAKSPQELFMELRRLDALLLHETAESMHADVPAPIPQTLKLFKHALRDRIVQIAESPGSANLPSVELEQQVIRRLESEGVPVDIDGGFGSIQKITFEHSAVHKSWLIATTHLSISHGADVSLYLFQRRGGLWKHVLTSEANDYDGIDQAQGSLRYYVAPSRAGQEPYLVTVEITPWPTSRWQAIRLKVLRVGDTPDVPRVLVQQKHSYCLDGGFQVAIRPQGFALLYVAESDDSRYGGCAGAVYYREYAVHQQTATVDATHTVNPTRLLQRWIASHPARAPFDEGEWVCHLDAYSVAQRDPNGSDPLTAIARCARDTEEDKVMEALIVADRDGFRFQSVKPTPKPR